MFWISLKVLFMFQVQDREKWVERALVNFHRTTKQNPIDQDLQVFLKADVINIPQILRIKQWNSRVWNEWDSQEENLKNHCCRTFISVSLHWNNVHFISEYPVIHKHRQQKSQVRSQTQNVCSLKLLPILWNLEYKYQRRNWCHLLKKDHYSDKMQTFPAYK